MTSPQVSLRLGTRASPLAQWQADWVTERLDAHGAAVERVLIATSGDRNRTDSIAKVGTVGAFTKEIQRALLDRRIDAAVHSLKDLPTEPTPGLVLAAIPERGPCGDVLVTLDGRTLDELPLGARVGTGSLRRRAHLWHVRPDLKMEDIRGNVDTRLRKLQEREYDAIVLAAAGLARLGLAKDMSWPIDLATLLPAVGQGALGVEMRADEDATAFPALAAIVSLNHRATKCCVLAEREMLAALCAGCLAPVGGLARVEGDGTLVLAASVLSFDGRQKVTAEVSGKLEDYAVLGQRAAAELIDKGADALIREARER